MVDLLIPLPYTVCMNNKERTTQMNDKQQYPNDTQYYPDLNTGGSELKEVQPGKYELGFSGSAKETAPFHALIWVPVLGYIVYQWLSATALCVLGAVIVGGIAYLWHKAG